LFLGNRGGRFHTDAKTLTLRRWASRQWICCVLDFKGRHRDVWGRFYTELFFLDEPTALCGRASALFRMPSPRRLGLCPELAGREKPPLAADGGRDGCSAAP
jgi:hypothetical protein